MHIKPVVGSQLRSMGSTCGRCTLLGLPLMLLERLPLGIFSLRVLSRPRPEEGLLPLPATAVSFLSKLSFSARIAQMACSRSLLGTLAAASQFSTVQGMPSANMLVTIPEQFQSRTVLPVRLMQLTLGPVNPFH